MSVAASRSSPPRASNRIPERICTELRLARMLEPDGSESEPTGKTIFVIDEYYASPAGIARHWQDAADNWSDMAAAMAWSAKGTVATLHNGTAVQALS